MRKDYNPNATHRKNWILGSALTAVAIIGLLCSKSSLDKVKEIESEIFEVPARSETSDKTVDPADNGNYEQPQLRLVTEDGKLEAAGSVVLEKGKASTVIQLPGQMDLFNYSKECAFMDEMQIYIDDGRTSDVADGITTLMMEDGNSALVMAKALGQQTLVCIEKYSEKGQEASIQEKMANIFLGAAPMAPTEQIVFLNDIRIAPEWADNPVVFEDKLLLENSDGKTVLVKPVNKEISDSLFSDLVYEDERLTVKGNTKIKDADSGSSLFLCLCGKHSFYALVPPDITVQSLFINQ